MALIKARVVAYQYGSHFRGEIIEVEEREILRVGPTALVSLADESRRKAEEERPALESDPEALVRKEQAAAWRELAKKSDALVEKQRIEQAQKIAQLAQPKPEKKKGGK